MSLRNWTSLRKRADFLHIQKNGQKWITPAFVIQSFFDDSVTTSEIGFTATKKLGGAVVRNRAKRRLRAACDEVFREFPIKNRRFVLIARDEALTREFPVLLKDLRWALRRLDVIANDKVA